MHNQDKIQEAIRLRVEDQMSLSLIASELRIAKSTASRWLSEYPLDTRRLSELRPRGKGGTSKPIYPRDGESSAYYKWVTGKTMSPLHKGRIAEAAVLFRLALLNYEVYSPQFDGDKCDMIVRRQDGELLKIQVRWTKMRTNARTPCVSLHCSDGPHNTRRLTESEYDFLVGYDLFRDKAYVWTYEETSSNNSTMSVSKQAEEAWNKLE